MNTKNISFFELDDKSYLITDQSFLGYKWYNYEDSYNYYDINVNYLLLYKKSDNEYVIRYNDKYKSAFAPLQLRIKNFSSKMEIYTNDDKVMSIYSDDEELFKKCKKIWNKVTKLIGINNAPGFAKTNSNGEESIMADVHENTSFIEDNYENELVIVLDSVFNEYPNTLLIKAKKHKCTRKKHMINAPASIFL